MGQALLLLINKATRVTATGIGVNTKHKIALMITTQVINYDIDGTCSQTALELSWSCTGALCLFGPVESRNMTGPYYHPDIELVLVYCETFYL